MHVLRPELSRRAICPGPQAYHGFTGVRTAATASQTAGLKKNLDNVCNDNEAENDSQVCETPGLRGAFMDDASSAFLRDLEQSTDLTLFTRMNGTGLFQERHVSVINLPQFSSPTQKLAM